MEGHVEKLVHVKILDFVQDLLSILSTIVLSGSRSLFLLLLLLLFLRLLLLFPRLLLLLVAAPVPKAAAGSSTPECNLARPGCSPGDLFAVQLEACGGQDRREAAFLVEAGVLQLFEDGTVAFVELCDRGVLARVKTVGFGQARGFVDLCFDGAESWSSGAPDVISWCRRSGPRAPRPATVPRGTPA